MSDSQVDPGAILHIFAQYSWHGPARIAGTKPALQMLAAALEKAIQHGEAECDPVFVNDGEGYAVQVQCTDDTDSLGDPYLLTYANEEAAQWQTRAFKAEAALAALRKSIKDGATE
jgi:hypothetical protein